MFGKLVLIAVDRLTLQAPPTVDCSTIVSVELVTPEDVCKSPAASTLGPDDFMHIISAVSYSSTAPTKVVLGNLANEVSMRPTIR